METLAKRKLVVVAFVGFTLFLALVFHSIFKSPPQSGSGLPVANATEYAQKETNFGLPVRINIPSIQVDAAVAHVGLTSDGAMDVPNGPTDAAWFDLGPRPGERGSAVLAGHYDWKHGAPAVFHDLHTLRKGDKVYTEDDEGVITAFVVRESRKYDPNADASDVFGSQDGKVHLNLITCAGVWNETQKSYSNRLVVFADKE